MDRPELLKKRTGFWALFLVGMACFNATTFACTIFVLTDGSKTIFFNNEDFSNPHTRLWFVPAGSDYHGGAYVGFDDGWAQGGVNTEGLAYDWVAGFADAWKPSAKMQSVRGNSSQRMLESCSTVDEAIAFYQTHREAEFARARILVADKTGASVIIGAHNGKLVVERRAECRGFGYGREALANGLAQPPEPTLANGTKILAAARQEGQFATKYSNAFDLRMGDIFFLSLGGEKSPTKLNLQAELQKGPHFYDIPQLEKQLTEAPAPLPTSMKRFALDEFPPIPDPDPKTSLFLTRVMREAAAGRMRATDYSEKVWSKIGSHQKAMQGELNKLGKFRKLTRVQSRPEDPSRTYRYRMLFSNATVQQIFTLDEQNRVAGTQSEGAELQPK